MRFKSLLSVLLSVFLGTIFGAVIKLAFALPKAHPTDGLYQFILETPLGRFAPESFSQNEIIIHIAIRAIAGSILAGAIAGAVLRKLKFKRVFCYSALWVFVADIALCYLALIASSDSGPEKVSIIRTAFIKEFWIDFWVYGWYYAAIYLVSIFFSSNIKRSIEPA